MTIDRILLVAVLVAMAIAIRIAITTARRAATTTNSILELAAAEPAAATDWRPTEEVRAAILDTLAGGQPHSIRLLTSAHTANIVGTPLQRYQQITQLAQEGRIAVQGPMTLAAYVRLHNTNQ